MLNVKSIFRFLQDANYSQNEYIFDYKTYISKESPESVELGSAGNFFVNWGRIDLQGWIYRTPVKIDT